MDDLIEKLKISPGTDRFLLEVHPKLRPVELLELHPGGSSRRVL